ncbi:MAG: cytochrome C peroxidase, partial [Bacteroidota bacterium]|nr:cytochrome C peroxidase [Bacteroidota bacterium]
YETLDQIVDFYNRGGGAGMGMDLPYQTLPFDELNLSKSEQKDLVSFMKALSDTIGLTDRPIALPGFEGHPEWNTRKIGGLY